MSDKLRVDKWVWAARFFKTRSIAVEAIGKGRVLVNRQPVKPAREVGVGDEVEVRRGDEVLVVQVRAISGVRGPAPQARLLYEETAESVAARDRYAEQRRLAPEPSADLDMGRPTKRDRRQMERWRFDG
ncbi:RNA-binding S4 domain-containing protein [Achromobacter sp. GG226]|uniref:RNA-binding S4 domain-containing protein n=1 Tax=Verticiella alkaliphila TaxID=2779529 RepID=UPI001C0AE41C|nr:RNA-binding S4 domain-containing protein [Verticiella sp. GG226]MBU4611593.1 RNA-binding S4 domain-containing protein [Verticiella sp. GG226]